MIPPLQHGNSSCVAPINETTDTTCSFFCNKGFKIDGSTMRTCQANHHWNGTTNKCESKSIKLCVFLECLENLRKYQTLFELGIIKWDCSAPKHFKNIGL